MTDRDTIERAKQGDREAFEHIYKNMSGFVYASALALTGSPDDANEVTQEVFIKVYKRLSGFEYRSRFKTWLYRIVYNTAIDFFKRERRAGGGDFNGSLETLEARERAEDGALSTETKKRLTAILDMLSREQRECIVLREIEGMSYREIAETLEININTVRTRLVRARLSLVEHARACREDERWTAAR